MAAMLTVFEGMIMDINGLMSQVNKFTDGTQRDGKEFYTESFKETAYVWTESFV